MTQMEEHHKRLLRTKRIFLTNHLQPILSDVVDTLLGSDVLNDNMKQEIEAQSTQVSKVRMLLDVLPRRGPYAFTKFTDALLRMKEYDILRELDPELVPAVSSGVVPGSPTQPTAESVPPTYKPTISRKEPTKPPTTASRVPVPVPIPVPAYSKANQPEPQKTEPRIGRQLSREIQRTEQPSENTDEDLVDWPKKIDLSPEGIKKVTIQESTHDDLKRILSDTQVYDLQSQTKGRAVVIKNITYEESTGMKQRNSADWDAYRLVDILKRLRFNVKQYVNQTKEKLLEKLKREGEEDHNDAFILVILSYGGVGTVMCTDGREVPLRDIINVFTTENCPNLKNKPKLFFIQACGTKYNDGTTQGVSQTDDQKATDMMLQNATDAMKSLGLGAGDATGDIIQGLQDMLVAIATQPDVTLDQEKYLSLFILALWTVLYKFSRNHHILELMEKVNTLKKESGQPVKLCEFKDSLTKKFYFMPGYMGEDHSSIETLPSLPSPNLVNQ